MVIRRPLTTASLLSLLLCAGTTALWLRSYWRHDQILREAPHSLHGLESYEGNIIFWRHRYETGGIPGARGWLLNDPRSEGLVQEFIEDEPDPWWHQWGVGSSKGYFSQGVPPVASGTTLSYSVPHRSISLLSAIFPAIWIGRLLFRRRHRPGFCRSCGYDLRASADRCPECGTVTETKLGN